MAESRSNIAEIIVVGTCQYYCRGVASTLETGGFTRVISILLEDAVVPANHGQHNSLFQPIIDSPSGLNIIIMLGRNIPPKSLFDLARGILAQQPNTRIILHTDFANAEVAKIDAAHLGISACLVGQINDDDLLRAVQAVADGHMGYTPAIMRKAQQVVELSQVHRQVVRGWAEGKTDREIAAELNLTPKTVRNYASIILEKLQVHDRRLAVMHAKHRGWI